MAQSSVRSIICTWLPETTESAERRLFVFGPPPNSSAQKPHNDQLWRPDRMVGGRLEGPWAVGFDTKPVDTYFELTPVAVRASSWAMSTSASHFS